MIKIRIETEEGNTYTYVPVDPQTYELVTNMADAQYAVGGSCTVYTVADADGRRYLLKKHHGADNREANHSRITEILERFHKKKSNYILKDLFVGHGYEYDDTRDDLKDCSSYEAGAVYQVFDYTTCHTVEPYSGTKSIFEKENASALYQILTSYVSSLQCLSVLHEKQQGVSYLHADIKNTNCVCFQVNQTSMIQLIDFGSLQIQEDLIKRIDNGEEFMDLAIETSTPWYSAEDFAKLCTLKGEELESCIQVIDTTAATRLLSYMLTANEKKFTTTEKDKAALESNETLNYAVTRFFNIGLNRQITERFKNTAEMIERVSAMLSAIEVDLPMTIAATKLRALGGCPVIKSLQDKYILRHGFQGIMSRQDVFTDKLLGDIDESILPNIQLPSQKPFEYKRGLTPLRQLLAYSSESLVIEATAGWGKTSSLLCEFIKELRSDSPALFIYAPLAGYSGDNIVQHILDVSGMPFEELIKNSPNQIIVFLDGFDEMNLSKENERLFWKQIRKLQVQVIVTTRPMPIFSKSDIPFPIAKFCPLTDTQIESYLSEHGQREVKSDSTLDRIISTPLFLTVYGHLLERGKLTREITHEAEMLDLYFCCLYDHKKGIQASESPQYQELIQHIANRSLYNERRCYNIEKESRGFSSIVFFDDEWGAVVFSHSIYRDYFVAKALSNQLNEIRKRIDKYYPEIATPTKLRLEETIVKQLATIFTAIDMSNSWVESNWKEAKGVSTDRELASLFKDDELLFSSIISSNVLGRFSDFTYRCVGYFVSKETIEKLMHFASNMNLLEESFAEELKRIELESHAIMENPPLSDYACYRRHVIPTQKQLKNFQCTKHYKSIWLPANIRHIKNSSFYTDQLHFDGTVDSWMKVKMKGNKLCEAVYCSDGILNASFKYETIEKIDYCDEKELRRFDITEAEVKQELISTLKDNPFYSRVELIEKIVDTYGVSVRFGEDLDYYEYVDDKIEVCRKDIFGWIEAWLNSGALSEEERPDVHSLYSNTEGRCEVRIPLRSTSMEGHGLLTSSYEFGDGLILEYGSDGTYFSASYSEDKLASLLTIFRIWVQREESRCPSASDFYRKKLVYRCILKRLKNTTDEEFATI